MSDSELNQAMLKLAGIPGFGKGKKGPRRVATPQGAAYYGQPIGTIITADMIEAKRKENQSKGVSPSKGMLAPPKGANSGNSSSGASGSGSASSASAGGSPSSATPIGGNVHKQKSYPAPGVDGTPPPEWIEGQQGAAPAPAPELVKGLKETDLSGPKKFKVGGSTYSAPEGSRIVRPKSGADLAIIVTPDKQIRVFNDGGEVETDEALLKILSNRIGTSVKPDDSLYEEVEFEQDETLDSLQPGQKLYDSDGSEVFVKTEDGWQHSALGLPVDDADIQPFYESGELSSSKAFDEEEVDSFDWGDDDDVEIDFGAMSKDDFSAYISTLDSGDKLFFISPQGNGNDRELTYQGDDTFSDNVGNSFESSDLWWISSNLTENEEKYKAAVAADNQPEEVNDEEDAEAGGSGSGDEPPAGSAVEEPNEPVDPLEEYSEVTPFEIKDKVIENVIGVPVDNSSFLNSPPPGSQVLAPDGRIFTAEGLGKNAKWVGTDGTQIPVTSQTPTDFKNALVYYEAFDMLVKKNTLFDSKATFVAPFESSDDSPGSAPSLNFINNAEPGSVMIHTVSNREYVRTSYNGWIRKNNPGSNISKPYIFLLNSDDKLVVSDKKYSGAALPGDQIGADIDFDEFNELAMPGTKLQAYSDESDPVEFLVNDMGFWSSPQVLNEDGEVEEFEELPWNDYSFYVKDFVEGQPFGSETLVGTKPTLKWLEQSPVGAKFSVSYTSKTDGKVSSAVMVKADDNTWVPEELLDSDLSLFGADTKSFEKELNKENSQYSYSILQEGQGYLPDAPSTQQDAEGVTAAKGQQVKFEDLLASPNGTIFKYNKLDGTQSTYAKVNADFVLGPNGGLVRTKHWKDSIDKGKVEFANDTLLAVQPDGSVKVADPVPSVDNPPFMPSPSADDSENKEKFDTFVEELAEWELALLENPTSEDAPEAESTSKTPNGTPSGDSVFDDPTSKTVNFDSFGASAEDIWSTISLLEGHPHASPKYGLKSLPNDSPFKGNEDALVEKAKLTFPKLTAKLAVISFLKSKVEFSSEDDESSSASGPKMKIGAEKPAKNAFGVTGGEFTEQEISQAIQILKGYDGKQFKSQLTQKGNPLGLLDFNSLVGKAPSGPDGKLIQKQKVIEFLETKFSEGFNFPESEQGDPYEEPTENQLSPFSSYGFVDDLNPEAAGPGWKSITFYAGPGSEEEIDSIENFLVNLPMYTEISFSLDGDNASSPYKVTKLPSSGGDGVLFEGDTLEVDGYYPNTYADATESIIGQYDGFLAYKIPTTWEEPTYPKVDPKSLSPVSYPVGTKVMYRLNMKGGESGIAEYQGNGAQWVNTETGQSVENYVMYQKAVSGYVYLVSVPGESQNVATEENDFVGSVAELDGFPVGTVLVHDQGGENEDTYTKVGPNQWSSKNYSDVLGMFQDKNFKGSIDGNKLKVGSIPSPVDGPDKSPAALQDKQSNDPENQLGQTFHSYAPGNYFWPEDGSVIHVFADGSGHLNSDGEMIPLSASKVSDYHLNNWVYQGVTPTAPSTAPDTVKPKAPAVSIKSSDVPDGTYYYGPPSAKSTTVWVAESGVITEHKADGSKVTVSDTRLKNAILKGKLVNKFGSSSIIPEGFTGEVKLFGSPTTVKQLRALNKALHLPGNEYVGLYDLSYMAKNHGIQLSPDQIKNHLSASGHGTDYAVAASVMRDSLNKMVGSPDTYLEPDQASDTAVQFFDFVPNSKDTAFMPDNDEAILLLNTTSYSYLSGLPVTEARAKVKKGVDAIFGPGVVAQDISRLRAPELRSYLDSIKQGNFKNVYWLESLSATRAKTVLPEGWKHPGYAENTATHNVKFIGLKDTYPLEPLPGEWTSMSVFNDEASALEVDNYVVQAGFKYMAFLSPQERRSLVQAHRSENLESVRAFALRARLRAVNNAAPMYPEPVYTEGVKTGKSYSAVFDGGAYPTTAWMSYKGMQKAVDYVADFKAGVVELLDPDGNPVPYSEYEKKVVELGFSPTGSLPDQYVAQALSAVFANLAEKQEIKENTPVYSMAPTQTVKKSLHPIYNVVDQFGNKYIFKPAPSDPNSPQYRAEVEAGANKLSKMFGTSAPDAEVTEFNGMLGVMQKQIDASASLANFDMKSFTAKQAGQLAHEHIVDWMLDQDDNWGPNTLITPQGNLVGVDKGRSFINYGNWNGLVADSSMDVNTHLVYSDFYQKIINKQIPKEIADAAWFEAQRRADKISKLDKGSLVEVLHEATDSRKNWSVNYTIDGKKVPQTQEGFFEAFFDRQDRLPEDVRSLWEGIYQKAGYGDLPEPPKTSLGEGQFSGLDDSNFHETVMVLGSSGASTLLGSADIDQGHAIAWKIKNSDDTNDINLHFHLAKEKQKDVLGWFQANVDPNSIDSDPAPATDFTYDKYYTKFVSAAKTVNTHAVDGQYNQGTLSDYEALKENLAKDSEFWSVDLAPEGDSNTVSFPSGAQVPLGHLGQYKLMLDHYNNMSVVIDSAKENKTTTDSMVTKYESVNLPKAGVVYLSEKGKLVQTAQPNTWIYSSASGAEFVDDNKAKSIYSEPGWTQDNDPAMSGKAVYKAKLNPQTHDINSTYVDGQIIKASGKQTGMHGREFEVTLPTGEKIYFRNADVTQTTSLRQRGRVTVVVPGAKNADDTATGIARAQQWLEDNLGLNLGGATEDDAENIYWREMFEIVSKRNVGTNTEWSKVKADFEAKAAELKTNLAGLPFAMSQNMDSEEQNQFYRSVWSAHFGKDKVAALVDSRGYLPTYEAIDPHFSETGQGHPIWYRFDVTLADLEKAAPNMIGSVAYHSDHVLSVAKSGASMSTEERMRILGTWISGGSSSGDQPKGGSQAIFTRIYSQTKQSGINFIYNPKAMLRTHALSYPGDAWGNIELIPQVDANPVQGWIKNKTEATGLSGPELDLMYHSSIFGDLEIIIFDSAQQRQDAIQYYKKLGLEKIRGVPVELRFTMRVDLAKALAEIKKTWY